MSQEELSLQVTRAIVFGPWGAGLVIVCAIVIVLGVPGWGN